MLLRPSCRNWQRSAASSLHSACHPERVDELTRLKTVKRGNLALYVQCNEKNLQDEFKILQGKAKQSRKLCKDKTGSWKNWPAAQLHDVSWFMTLHGSIVSGMTVQSVTDHFISLWGPLTGQSICQELLGWLSHSPAKLEWAKIYQSPRPLISEGVKRILKLAKHSVASGTIGCKHQKTTRLA